jgi:hypothetical protein
MKDGFVNQLIISHLHSTLIIFLNMRKNVKVTYIVVRKVYYFLSNTLVVLILPIKMNT